jgi:hypothetical protein
LKSSILRRSWSGIKFSWGCSWVISSNKNISFESEFFSIWLEIAIFYQSGCWLFFCFSFITQRMIYISEICLLTIDDPFWRFRFLSFGGEEFSFSVQIDSDVFQFISWSRKILVFYLWQKSSLQWSALLIFISCELNEYLKSKYKQNFIWKFFFD